MRTILLCAVAPIAIMLSCNQAYAADGADGPAVATKPSATPSDSPEIVVTAQRREQRLQDVGIAVTALGSKELAALGHQDVSALVSLVPNLQVNQFAPTVTVFNIRGVAQNDFADSEEGPIATYVDDVYISSLGAISGQNFDLQRIEVLRGPQGTLFGRNATGGLIQFITAKPTDSLSGYLTASGGSYNEIATEGAISGPVSDWMKLRLSFMQDSRDGYIKNSLGPNTGGLNEYAVRLQSAMNFGSAGDLLLKAQLIRNVSDHSAGPYTVALSVPNAQGLGTLAAPGSNPYGTCAGCDLAGDPLPTGYYNSAAPYPNLFDRTVFDVSATYKVKLSDEISLTSVTGYQKLVKDYLEDTSATPSPLLIYQTYQRLEQASEELRLAGDHGQFNWTAGVYGMLIRSYDWYNVNLGVFGVAAAYGGNLHTNSIAAFTQGEYKFTDHFSVIGGLRYTYDKKTLDYTQSETDLPTTFTFNPAQDPGLANPSYSNWSGKFEIDYKPSRDLLFYASVNRGTKAGGFSTIGFEPFTAQQMEFKQEVLTNYEGGMKTTLINGRAHFGASVYHYDYTNYQAYLVLGTSQFVINKNANITGVELSGDVRVLDGLSLGGFFTYNHATAYGINLPDGETVNRMMPQAPRYSAGGNVRYVMDVAGNKLTTQFDFKYNSAQYFDVFNSPVNLEPGYWVGNVRIAYDIGHFTAAFYIHNVNNQQYRLSATDITNPAGLAQSVPAPPRTFGGSLTYNF